MELTSVLDIPISQLKTDYIRIENLQQFLIDVESINPANFQKYLNYWRYIKHLIVEGTWGEEFGKFRYCPGNLIFHGSLTLIQDTGKNKTTTHIKPLIRDLEWELAYGMLEAKGFSGYHNDEKYTSDLSIFEYNKNTTPEADLDPRILFQSNGKFKEFIDIRENIRMLHNYKKGTPLYLNESRNFNCLGSRGGGKSVYFSLAENLHELVTDGGKYYNPKDGQYYSLPWYDKKYMLTGINKPVTECLVGSGDTDKSSEFLSKIQFSMNALATEKEFGVWGQPGDDDYTPCPLFKDMAGTLAPGNKKNPWRHEYKLVNKGREIKKGTRSKINHVSYSENKGGGRGSQAGAGGRMAKSTVEESGLTSNTIEIQNSNDHAVARNGRQFGVQMFLGTSGNLNTIVQTKKMFLNPQDYNFIEYNDYWEKKGKKGKIGFFLPFYLTLNQLKDKNGNTDFKAAFEYISKIREAKADADDPSRLMEEKMNRPIIPSEMWISNRGHYLPYAEAEARESVLMKENLYKHIGTHVQFYWTPDGRVDYNIDKDADPFWEIHNEKKTTLDGAITIYDFPIKVNNQVPNDAYLFTYDPYVSDDLERGNSVGVVTVWLHPKYWDKMTTSPMVASYIGKHRKGLDGFHERLEKLVAFYGNPIQGIWYEKQRGRSCRDYFIKKHKGFLLAPSPGEFESHGGFAKQTVEYGINVGNRIQKIQYLDMYNDFLLKKVAVEGKEVTVISTIPCIFRIRQYMIYNLDDNFDAVSADILYPIAIKQIEYNMESKLKKKNNPLTFLSMNPRIHEQNNQEQIRRFKQRFK